jgi:tetratricopeptide (TPR) repeat protein
VYRQKLVEIRKDAEKLSEGSPRRKTPEYMRSAVKNPDIAMYKERNDQYKILSNRIKTRALLPERKYVDKTNVKILERFFDPLRIRLRVMPISRAPLNQGKSSDFYFVEAGKLSIKGELTKAIELLKRGLEIKPNHYLCRFNHGVLLFKLGLIVEAC